MPFLIRRPGRKVLVFLNCTKTVLTDHMQRREFIALLGGAAAGWPRVARAQRPFRIGLLNTGGAGTTFIAPFVGKLEEFGYLEGKNLVIERKFADGNSERLKEFAADLVRQHVDVIVTIGTPASYRQILVTAEPVRRRRLWANGQPVWR